jgi:hypothetical protein
MPTRSSISIACFLATSLADLVVDPVGLDDLVADPEVRV